MRTFIHLSLTEHEHPAIERIEDEDDGEAYEIVTIKLSEFVTINGDAKDVFNWIDELHARSQLIR